MGWADEYIKKLKAGETATFRPTGNSMTPKVVSGQLVTVKPVPRDTISKGDIVLCRVQNKQYLHLVKAVRVDPMGNRRFLIGNNHGKNNGWTSAGNVYGRLEKNRDEIETDRPKSD